MADQCDHAARLDLEVDVLQHRCTRAVLEADAFERDAPGSLGKRARAVAISNLLGLVENLEDALSGGRGPLDLTDPHAEHAQREDEHQQVHVERDEGTERQRSGVRRGTRLRSSTAACARSGKKPSAGVYRAC